MHRLRLAAILVCAASAACDGGPAAADGGAGGGSGGGGGGATGGGPAMDGGGPAMDGGTGGGTAMGGGSGGGTATGGGTGGAPDAGDFDFQGNRIPDPLPVGTYSGVMACEYPGFTPAPGLGGQVPCGSYAQNVAPACNAGLAGGTTNSINEQNLFVAEDFKLGNTHFYGNSIRFAQRPRQAFIIKFRTGGAGEFPVVGGLPPGVLGELSLVFANHLNRGEAAVAFATISRSACDFDYAKLDQGNPCYRSLNPSGGGIFMQIAPEGIATAAGKCAVEPNTIYYINLRWEDPSPTARGTISCRPTVGSGTYPFCGNSLTIN